MNLQSKLTISAVLFALPTIGFSQAIDFKVLGDKLQFRNLVSVESSTDFETFTGRTSAISGTIRFDPKGKTGSAKLSVEAGTLDTAIALRNEHLRSQGWLDTEKFPTISFVSSAVRSLGGDKYSVEGQFTLHGVTKKIRTEATVRYRAESADTKGAGFAGDVILVSTSFKVKLSDYGIKIPSQAAGKVSETVTISVKTYATSK